MTLPSPRWDGSPRPVDEPPGTYLWRLTKHVDELGGEWTYQIFVGRVLEFIRWTPVVYFPFSSYERMTLDVAIRLRALECGVDRSRLGDISLIFEIYPSFFDACAGRVPMPEPDELSMGQHSVNVVALEDDGIVFQHSWYDWSNNGLGYMTREFIERYGTEMWVCRDWSCGPRDTASALEILAKSTAPERVRELWRLPRPRGMETRLSSPGRRFKWHRSYVIESECPVEVLTVENETSATVAVGVLAYDLQDSGNRTCSLVDLFVWPKNRRRGYGSDLVQWAIERSRGQGYERMTACIWKSDSVTGFGRAKSFLESCKFDVVDIPGEGMQQVAYGNRVL